MQISLGKAAYCPQHYLKSYERIAMKFYREVKGTSGSILVVIRITMLTAQAEIRLLLNIS